MIIKYLENNFVLCSCCWCGDTFVLSEKEARDYDNTQYCNSCLLDGSV